MSEASDRQALLAAKGEALNDLPDAPGANAGSIQSLLVTGNSYAEGGGLPDRRQRFPLIAARALGGAEFSMAKDGAVLYRHNDTAGWRSTLRRVKPLKADGLTAANPANAGEWVGCAGGEVALLCRNTNDMLVLGPANQDIFIEALRSEACRMRECVWWGVDAAGWTFGGGAGSQQADSGTTDGVWRSLDAAGYGERDIPAHWPGGYMHAVVAVGSTIGSDYSIKVDGSEVASVDLPSKFASLASYVVPITRRFYVPASAAGKKLRVQSTDLGAGATFHGAFMGCGAEPPETGLVVLVGAHRLTPAGVAAYSNWGETNGVLWSANVNTLAQTALIRALAAEFEDGNVVVFDMDEVIDLRTELIDSTDLLHPSLRGHMLLGQTLARFIAMRLPRFRRRQPDRWLKISDPEGHYSGASFASGAAAQTFSIFPHPSFRREADGTVRLRGLMTRSSALGNGVAAPLTTLPQVMRPSDYVTRSMYGQDNGGTRQHVWGQVGPDGAVALSPTSAGVAVINGGVSWFSLDPLEWKASQ